MTTSWEVRDLTIADHEQALAVRTRSFGALHDSMRGWWTSIQDELIAQRRVVGVFDRERLVGTAKGRPFQQFWGGRLVAMSGVAGVVVLPEYRGRGVASLLMRALAQRCVELGDVVSALYPAAVGPYRSAGWEVAGTQTRITIASHLLRGLGSPDVRLRAGTASDVGRVHELLAESYAAQRANGPMLPTTAEVEESLGAESFSYFTDDGFVLYEWHEGNLVVNCLVAGSEASARALWGVVGSGASIAKQVHAYVSPTDPIHLLLPDEASQDVTQQRWMLRLLDAPQAIAARGFGPHVSGSASLTLEDSLLPANRGTWLLEVADGRGSLARVGQDAGAGSGTGSAASSTVTGSLRLGPNGLAALHAGMPLHSIRTAGLASGGTAAADAFLDSAFGGPAPFLLEYF
jgi:predicted acetyltransferase